MSNTIKHILENASIATWTKYENSTQDKGIIYADATYLIEGANNNIFTQSLVNKINTSVSCKLAKNYISECNDGCEHAKRHAIAAINNEIKQTK